MWPQYYGIFCHKCTNRRLVEENGKCNSNYLNTPISLTKSKSCQDINNNTTIYDDIIVKHLDFSQPPSPKQYDSNLPTKK